jgi:hypothetical protein
MDSKWVSGVESNLITGNPDQARIDPTSGNAFIGETVPAFRFLLQRYEFTPLEDMTPLEAAWIGIVVGTSARVVDLPQNHPQWDIIQRHFTMTQEGDENVGTQSNNQKSVPDTPLEVRKAAGWLIRYRTGREDTGEDFTGPTIPVDGPCYREFVLTYAQQIQDPELLLNAAHAFVQGTDRITR